MTGGLADGTSGPLNALCAQLVFELGDLSKWDVLVALGLAVLFATLSFFRIDAVYATSLVNNCIFGADSTTFWRWLAQGNYLAFVVHKHTLAVILTAIIAQPLVWVGVPVLTAAMIAIAAIWGAVAGVAYIYFRRAKLSPRAAGAMTFLAFSSLAITAHSGIAETYGATLLMIALACLFLPAISKLAANFTWTSSALAGFIGTGLAVANAPAAAIILIYYTCLPLGALREKGIIRAWPIVALPLVLIATAVVAPALVAEGADGATWHLDYLDRYASLSNFTDPATHLDFLASAFVFAFVAPLEHLQCRFVASDFLELSADPLRLAAYLLNAALLVIGVSRAFGGASQGESIGIVSAVLAILTFYLFFNPDEALLYSPQWVLALWFLASPSLARASLWVGLAAALSLWVNLPALHDERTFDPEVCCRNPPTSMLPIETPASLLQQQNERMGER